MLKKIYHFYYDGFSNLSSWSKTLWLIIIVKVVIMFGVFKFWLMPNYLNHNFDTKEEKVDYIYNTLIQ